MSINERIKYFRKEILHINQTEFAAKLGMKQTSVSTIEQEGATVTEPTLHAICLAFHLNEDWLRNGTEPMYTSAESFSLDTFLKKSNATELELQIMKAYFSLDPKIRKAALEHFKSYLSKK